jgi:hypothetical protein
MSPVAAPAQNTPPAGHDPAAVIATGCRDGAAAAGNTDTPASTGAQTAIDTSALRRRTPFPKNLTPRKPFPTG